MKPSFFSVLLLAGAAALFLSVSNPVSAQENAAGAAPPNVVYLISDDQAWTDYGFMGHPNIQTPHLDKLAAESLTFTRGYVPASLCRPSLMTMVSGLHPWQHKITGNEPPIPLTEKGRKDKSLPQYQEEVQAMIDYVDRVPTLPRLLAEKGYVSHQSGKWWEGNHARGGFTAGMTHGDPKRGGRHGDEGLKIGREGMDPVLDFIDTAAADKKPFFIWYAPFLPHTPHTPPDRLFAKYKNQTDSEEIAKYWAMCEWFDETCGALLDHLDEKGLRDNTVVLYVCDNGWIQQPDSKGYAPRSKRSQYDGGVRTPIMVRWPGHVEPQTVETPVSSIDMVPTVLSACGMADRITPEMQGVNLMDLEAVKSRDMIFGDIYLHNAVDIHEPAKNLTYRWGLDTEKGWKLILPHKDNVTQNAKEPGSGEVELYNVFEDPFETKNLAEEKPEKVKALTARIDAWWPAKP